MEKIRKILFILLLLAALAATPLKASGEQKATSDVGITFYQSPQDKQSIPMKKVECYPTSTGEKYYPQTNDTQEYLLPVGGLLLLGIAAAVRKTTRK